MVGEDNDSRLRLEREGILERCFYSDHPPRAEYRFTEKGKGLGSVVGAMAEWGYEHRLTDEQRAAAPALVGHSLIGRR